MATGNNKETQNMEVNDESRIYDYIVEGNNIELSEKKISELDASQFEFPVRVEPKTRRDDLTESLKFGVYDPLWMLSRQWQMGEFRANNAGTALSVRCSITREDHSADPIEPVTEMTDPNIDMMARIESAMYYIELLRESKGNVKNELSSLCKNESLRLDWDGGAGMVDYGDSDRLSEVKAAERDLNPRLAQFRRSFPKAFDGYKLYQSLQRKSKRTDEESVYVDWFRKTYLPCEGREPAWDDRSMSYKVDIKTPTHTFVGDRYQGGRVSWHTVDRGPDRSGAVSQSTESITSLPTIVSYQGAPNKRLWQFEDKRVFLGNSKQQQSSANELFMRFSTMYSNDWMMIPFNTRIGSFVTVNSIAVKDTFGQERVIDGSKAVDSFFSNTRCDSRDSNNREITARGLFYAPQLANTIEGKPVEQVDFLRDEMANMVWGVETVASDQCGTTIDQKMRATQLENAIDRHNEEILDRPGGVVAFDSESNVRIDKKGAAYQYKLRTKVPYNWIPFVPQQNTGNNRDMSLRRGKMPCYILENDDKSNLHSVLPVTSILRKGLDSGKYQPMYINEEEVQQTGMKLMKNFQRARWINGKCYNWLGMYKRLAKFSEKSGLEYDTLKKK